MRVWVHISMIRFTTTVGKLVSCSLVGSGFGETTVSKFRHRQGRFENTRIRGSCPFMVPIDIIHRLRSKSVGFFEFTDRSCTSPRLVEEARIGTRGGKVEAERIVRKPLRNTLCRSKPLRLSVSAVR